MDDTISRQAALNAKIDLIKERDGYRLNDKEYGYNTALFDYAEAIEDLPSAERRGRWKGAGMGDYNCSLCGHLQSGKTNYCPNCGAKMEGEKE